LDLEDDYMSLSDRLLTDWLRSTPLSSSQTFSSFGTSYYVALRTTVTNDCTDCDAIASTVSIDWIGKTLTGLLPTDWLRSTPKSSRQTFSRVAAD
jgi:hypothetical protein